MIKNSRYWDLSEKDRRIFRDIHIQIKKVYNDAIYRGLLTKKTGRRYMAALILFGKFLVECYQKKNLNYIEPKHIYAFIEQAWEAGYSKSSIETTLSAIRDFYDRVREDGASQYLPTNDALRFELEEIGFVTRNKIDRIGRQRAWTENEVEEMKKKAVEMGYCVYADIIEISRAFGLRIHEAIRLTIEQINNAKATGKLTVKGKGGLVRDITLRNGRQIAIIDKLSSNCSKGKVFLNENEKAHELIKKVQHFIYNNREDIQENIKSCKVLNRLCMAAKFDGTLKYDNSIERANITPHGLRHTWAIEYYLELIAAGVCDIVARKIVSKELGHFRTEITMVYLKI